MKKIFFKSLFVLFVLFSHSVFADLNYDLLSCCKTNNMDCVKRLISQGADVNSKDMYNNSALILAVYNGNYDIANYLIEKGANPNFTDNSNKTAIDYAAEKDKLHFLNKYYSELLKITESVMYSKLYNEREEALDEQKIEDEKASISFAAYLDYLKEANDKAEKEQTNGGYDASGSAQPYSLASLAPIIAPPPTVKKIAIPTYYDSNRKVVFLDIAIENNTQKHVRSITVECKAVLDGLTIHKEDKMMVLSIDPKEKILNSIPIKIDAAYIGNFLKGRLKFVFNVKSAYFKQ